MPPDVEAIDPSSRVASTDLLQQSAAPGKLPLSCYIRTLDEERRIGEVIAAVQDLADEIVIVDNGSTDATVEICTALGARVVHQPWLGNGFQKRAGEEASTNDWLLDLDGDEIVTGELKDEIRALFARGEPPGSVYALKLSTVDPTGREWIGFGESYRNKLYDRRRHRMPEHRMWDQLELPSDVKPIQLNGRIRHHAFSDFAHVSNKLNRGSSRRAQYGKQRSKSALRFRVLFLFPFYFFKHFLQRRFVKGGTYGFAHAMVAAHGRWLRDAKQYEALLIEEARARGDIPPAATSGDE